MGTVNIDKAYYSISLFLSCGDCYLEAAVSVHLSALHSVGYFVEPTIVQVADPKNKLMQEVRQETVDVLLMVPTVIMLP